MEQLKDTMKTTTHENVKTKILELIQAWAYAFRNTPKYRAVQVIFLEYQELLDVNSKINVFQKFLQIMF